MKAFSTNRFILCLLALSGLLITACDPHADPEKEEAPALTQKVNKYMLDIMEEVYLWEQHIPGDLDIRYEFDEKDFFEKLCYRTEDRWSFITDDVQTLLEGSQGVETTFGYSLAFGKFSNTSSLFAVIQYVYPQTPASEAGLKRGDIIVEMNGQSITEDNYTNLYYASSLSLTMGEYKNNTISNLPGPISLTSRKQSLNPVVASKFIEDSGHRIGYMCYTDFFGGSDSNFLPVLQSFKEAGITDLVLDLRYNLGGYLSTARILTGALCPASCLNGTTVLVSKHWNKLYQDYWTENKRNDMLFEYFPKASEQPLNLNLSRIYILTAHNTASASELTLCGLEPYMEVIQVGTPTRGKYTAAMVFSPEKGTNIENWGTQAIVYRYANALGVTDFREGFIPDYEKEDELLEENYPLGDVREGLFAKAISLITGKKPVTTKQALKTGPAFIVNPSLASRPAAFHNDLIDTYSNTL